MFPKIYGGLVKLVWVVAMSLFSGYAMAAGALAIDHNQGQSYGWAIDAANVNQAMQQALSECGGGCQVVLRFEKGCGAYAADQSGLSTASGWGIAATGQDAQSRAMSECLLHSGRSCIVRVWGCN